MKTTGTIFVVIGWLSGVILVCIPLVYAIQNGSFISTIVSTWVIWVVGVILFAALTESGKYLRNKEANNGRR